MIELKNVSKTFSTSDGNVEALKDINITIENGDIFGIIGMSGAGKSTLVRTINLLEKPTSGQIIIDGLDMGSLKASQLRAKRRKIAMIFQGFNLLMQKNVLRNVCFPLELAGVSRRDARKKALELLEVVGLSDKANAYPSRLSGGQQQRVAIARALANDPDILLCDEATSALDPNTTNQILDLIKEINNKTGITVVVITHQMSVVERICHNVAILDNGVVAESGSVERIFAHPKTAAGRRLVLSDNGIREDGINISDHDKPAIRLVFNGAKASYTPLIAQMAIDTGIKANICHASTRSIGEKAYGSMILSFKDINELDKATDYLAKFDNVEIEKEDHNE